MAVQQHQILRQVLEARKCPRPDAQRVQAELRDMYYRQLLPVIDKVCSSLSSPGRIHRIERLEIDLGPVPLGAPDSALAVLFETSFQRELATAIDEAPETDSDLELFTLFTATGTVPWWADLSDPALVETALERLIGRAPGALRHTMRQGGNSDRRLSRLVRACSDRVLDHLAVVLAPSLLPFPRRRSSAWVPVIESLTRARGNHAAGARHLWWEEVLRAASAGGAHLSDVAGFIRAVLMRISQRLGIDYRLLIADLHSLDDDAFHAEGWVREVADGLARETGQRQPGLRRTPAAPGRHAGFAQLLDRLDARHGGLWALLGANIDRLPQDLKTGALTEAGDFLAEPVNSANALSRPLLESLAALIHAALRQKLVASEPAARILAALQSESRAGAATLTPSRETGDSVPLEEALAEFPFSHADAVYVENAGLVILWPFLKIFFTRAALVEDAAFTSPAAAHRGAGLLQYIATGEAPLGEHLLPLNKVLCGIPIEEVFDFGDPMTDAEREECDSLLVAVIQQAPILRQMSIAGFRGSFLLRNGQIRLRDGHWLLRVERATHDIVLDRFPWSVHVVKLPWMESVMQVEW